MRLTDNVDIKDLMNVSDYSKLKTKIIIRNHDTGEIIWEGKNKVVLAGAGYLARLVFGLKGLEVTPSYNSALNLDNTIYSDVPVNQNICCLFCVGINGCGRENSQVWDVDYASWIDPESIVPFQYRPLKKDITDAERKVYFGRKTTPNYYAYYFKAFDTQPTLVQQYTNGTPIDDTVYTNQMTTGININGQDNSSDQHQPPLPSSLFDKRGFLTISNPDYKPVDRSKVNNFVKASELSSTPMLISKIPKQTFQDYIKQNNLKLSQTPIDITKFAQCSSLGYAYDNFGQGGQAEGINYQIKFTVPDSMKNGMMIYFAGSQTFSGYDPKYDFMKDHTPFKKFGAFVNGVDISKDDAEYILLEPGDTFEMDNYGHSSTNSFTESEQSILNAIIQLYKNNNNSNPFMTYNVEDATPPKPPVTNQKPKPLPDIPSGKVPVETYVTMGMSISKYDCRDWFINNNTTSINDARINTLSLCTAWYKEIDGVRVYQDIRPFTKLNFPNEPLIKLRKAMDIEYQIYF